MPVTTPIRAQSGIARSAATPCGYYTPFTVRITIKGTDWTSKIDKNSVVVEQSLAGSTAQLTVVEATGGLYPEYGEVVITQGSSGNRLFGGYVMQPTLIRRRSNSKVRVALACVDYSWILDRYRIVGKRYNNLGPMTILGDLLAQLPSNQRVFTPDSDGTPYTDIDFQANHSESIAEAINRLADRVGAQWYVDAYKVVHFYVIGQQTAGSSATPLSNTTTHFWGLTIVRDPNQTRNRIYSHGGRAGTTAVGIPGSTTLSLDDTSEFGASGGEVLCGADYLTYTGKTDTALTGIPTSGTGSIRNGIPIGEDARILAIRNNEMAQTSLADSLGSSYLASEDGVVSHAIDDGSATDAAARDNGDGELSLYAAIPTTLTYLTRDVLAVPNRTLVTADLTIPWVMTSPFHIRTVTITGFGSTTKRPLREVEAGRGGVGAPTIEAVLSPVSSPMRRAW